MSEYIKSVRSLRSVADAYRSMKDPRSLNDKVEEQLIESIIQDVQTEEDDLFRVDTLNIVNQYLNEFPSDLQEGAIKDIIMDFEDGIADMKIAKSRGIDIKVIRGLKKDWLGIQKKHQTQLAAQYNEESKVVELLQKKLEFARNQRQRHDDAAEEYREKASKVRERNPDDRAADNYDMKADKQEDMAQRQNDKVRDLRDAIKDAKKRERMRSEETNLQEGTWAIPDSKDKLEKLNRALVRPIMIKTEKDLDKAAKIFAAVVGDDGVADAWYKMMLDYEDVKKVGDARDPVVKFLKDWGVKLSGYKITHAPGSWVSGFDDDEKSTRKIDETLEEGLFDKMMKKWKGKGKIKKKREKSVKVEGRRPPSKMSGSKLTGQEISVYFRKNPKAKKDKMVQKAVEIALDHGGAMNYAIDKIEKLKRGLEKHPEVKKALKFANEERIPHYKGYELVVQEELSRKDQIKLAAFGKQLSSITGFKWDGGKDPEVAMDRLFGQIRSKGKYSPAGWEKIHKMVSMLDKIGVKLPSLKGFYMGMDKKTGKGIFHEDVKETIKDIKEGIEEIVEAQTMKDADIKKIADMTDRNDHNGSLIHLAKLLGDRKGLDALKGIMMTHKALGHMPKGLIDTRNSIFDDLMKQSKKKYRNHADIYNAL